MNAKTDKPQHTPEPWRASDYTLAGSNAEAGACVMAAGDTVCDLPFNAGWTEAQARANAARIVQCVNACAGVADPAKAIEAARVLIYGGAQEPEDLLQRAIDAAHAAGIER